LDSNTHSISNEKSFKDSFTPGCWIGGKFRSSYYQQEDNYQKYTRNSSPQVNDYLKNQKNNDLTDEICKEIKKLPVNPLKLQNTLQELINGKTKKLEEVRRPENN
jgi:uncharacterized protein YkwD